MTHIVRMEFDVEFGTNRPIPKQIGRIMLGPYVGRLALSPRDGSIMLVIDERAVTDGHIVVYKPIEPPITGFGVHEEA